MRKLYRPIYIFTIAMKNGDKHTKKISYANMRYNDAQDQYVESYSSEMLESFCDKYFYWVWVDWIWKFKKYIRFINSHKQYIIKDIESITVSKEHEEISENTCIASIANELTSCEYLQFLFDKEQELKQAATMFGQ